MPTQEDLERQEHARRVLEMLDVADRDPVTHAGDAYAATREDNR
jgi:hypothetical protein